MTMRVSVKNGSPVTEWSHVGFFTVYHPLAFLSVHILTDTTTYLAININILRLELSQEM